MTDQEAIEYVIGCLKEIREASRPWGTISITVENGRVKYVDVTKTPRYKLEDGEIMEQFQYGKDK